MTLQVAKIAATTAATPYGTLQVAGVTVAAATQQAPPPVTSTLQVSAVTVTSTAAAIIPTTLQVASVKASASSTTQPPTATIATGAQTVDAGQTIALAGDDTDPYGTITQRNWRVVTGTATLTGTTTQTAAYKAPASLTDQTITIAYKVTSSTGLVTETTVTHTVLAATERAIRGGVEVPIYIS